MTLPIKLESVYDGGSTEIATIDGGVVTVGRHQDNTIVIDSNSVSRNHGELRSAQSHWVYKDLGSTNGTFVNDLIVPAGKLKLIRNADLICISNFHIAVTYLDSKPADCVNSLLIFYEDKFFSEYFPQYNEDVFYAGGDNHQILIEGEDPHTVQFLVKFRNDAFSLQVFQAITPILLNGYSVNNFVNLKDSDEIIIGNFTIIVNSQRTVERADAPADTSIKKQPPLAMGLIGANANSENSDVRSTAAFALPEQEASVSVNDADGGDDYDGYNGARLNENDFLKSNANNSISFSQSAQAAQAMGGAVSQTIATSIGNASPMSGWAKTGVHNEPIDQVNKFSRSEMVFDEATPTTTSSNRGGGSASNQGGNLTAGLDAVNAVKRQALNVTAAQMVDKTAGTDKVIFGVAAVAIFLGFIAFSALLLS